MTLSRGTDAVVTQAGEGPEAGHRPCVAHAGEWEPRDDAACLVDAGVTVGAAAPRRTRRRAPGSTASSPCPTPSPSSAWPASRCSSGCSSARTTRLAAAILLAVLGATDWVDGFVARRWHQVSTLGKVLDPVADRILVGTAVIAVIVARGGAGVVRRGHPGPRGAGVGGRAPPGRARAPSGSTCCGWARPGPSASCSPIPRSSWPTATPGGSTPSRSSPG